MGPLEAAAFEAWVEALKERHLSRLSFAEVRRALQALSSLYVERRSRLGSGAALSGAGKRAAFALFYGPLHFLLVRAVIRELGAGQDPLFPLVDLGCGSGASGAAWARECRIAPDLIAVDGNPWAVEETRWTFRTLGLRGIVRRADLRRFPLPGRGAGIVAAFTLNEMDPAGRGEVWGRLLDASRRGASVLVVEPLARGAVPWWEEWVAVAAAAGGRSDAWRFPADLPEPLRLLDRAAGMDHRELTGRSLWIAGISPDRSRPRAE